MIQFKNVFKTYPNGTQALKDVTLHVEDGEFAFIVGSSGAGKSTFLKMIMCEERADKGQILVNGTDLTKIKKRKIPYLRRSMGIVFQDFRLINHMTVYENVAFAMHVIGASERVIRKRVPYILGMVGLQDKMKSKPSELSGGEQQRVGLARALVNNPSMIVADEPTGNIDPELSFEIVDLLSEINKRGTTVLMVTHEHSLVKHFAHRIIEIEDGRIVTDTADMDIVLPAEQRAQMERAAAMQPIPEADPDLPMLVEEPKMENMPELTMLKEEVPVAKEEPKKPEPSAVKEQRSQPAKQEPTEEPKQGEEGSHEGK